MPRLLNKQDVLVSMSDVRQQLSDQLRCLDQRVDCHLGMVSELQDYYRRHSEIEAELARSLDKLDKQIRARHKAEKQRSVPRFLHYITVFKLASNNGQFPTSYITLQSLS